jgi:hypothetical protein
MLVGQATKSDARNLSQSNARQDYEQRPPNRILQTLEPLVSGALTAALLLLPAISAPLFHLRPVSAALWLLLALLAARGGSCSPASQLAGVFLVQGPFQLPAGFPWAMLCAVLDACFLIGTVGLGALPNSIFRAVTGQSVVERLLGLDSAVETVRPARMGGVSPGAVTPGGYGGSGGRHAAVTPRRL